MRKCALCGYIGNNYKIFSTICKYNNENLERYQCPNCDVIFGNDRMIGLTKAEMAREYAQVIPHANVNTDLATKYELEFFNTIGIDKKKHYINWGAGIWSSAVKKLQNQGFNIIGYDPYCKNSNTVIEGRQFNVIMTHNVLEHFQNPVKEIINMKKYLAPGGLMVHATACYSYCYEWSRFHLFFFLGRSVDKLCQLCGIKELKHKEMKTRSGQHIKIFKVI